MAKRKIQIVLTCTLEIEAPTDIADFDLMNLDEVDEACMECACSLENAAHRAGATDIVVDVEEEG